MLLFFGVNVSGWRDEAKRERGTAWSGSGFQQATINCNSKSLKLQQITGGKLTAKRLRCRRRRWLSSREMSTCGSRQRRQALPAGALWVPGMAPWTEVVLARAPFVVIFSANLLFPILVIDSIYTYIYLCVCVCICFVPCCCHSATTIATDDVDTICCCCCWVTKLGIYCKATRRVRRADLSLGTSFYEILFWFIYIKNYVFPLSHCPGGAHKVWYLFNAFLLWHFPQLQIG